MASLRGNCRETGDPGVVAGLAMKICSLRAPVLRINIISARGVAFATTMALVGFLLRAVIERRSRSSTGLPESPTSETLRGEVRAPLVPPSDSHKRVVAARALLGKPGLWLEAFGREHQARSALISSSSAPELMSFA